MDAADDEVPALSGSTLLALGDFLNGQLEDALTDADPFAEDWGLSQFWYTEETAMAVAEEVANIVGTDGRVACISCPSLFRSLLQSFPEVQCHLLEYDTRFEVFGNFVHYDYNKPLALPDELKGAFDVVLADPPYLSKECLEKTMTTTMALARESTKIKIFLLTGMSQKTIAYEGWGLRPAKFRPEHRNKLGNEFCLFCNGQPSERLGGWDSDIDTA